MSSVRKRSAILMSSAALAVAMIPGMGLAADFQWDPGLTPGTPSGGTGTWSTADANWSNAGTDVVWSTGNKAIFGATAGTVTLNSAVSATGMQFSTSGYTLSGTGTLTLTPAATGPMLSLDGGVDSISINLAMLAINPGGSGTIGDITNSDKINFNSTIVAIVGSRQFGVTNSSSSATTTITNVAASNALTPGATTIQLAQGNLNITNLAGGVSGGALAAANSTSATAEVRFGGAGAGTVTLNGNNTLLNNAGSGILTVKFENSNGTLAIGHNNALGARDAANNLTDTIFNMKGGTIIASGGARMIENAIAMENSSTIGGSNHLTFSGIFTHKGGSRTLTVNNTGATLISGPVYLSDSATGSRTFTIRGTGNAEISGVIANNPVDNAAANNIAKNDAGTLTLSNAANSYSGSTTISNGVLAVATLAPAGTNSPIGTGSAIAMGSTGTFRYTGATVSGFDRNFTGSSGYKVDVLTAGTTLSTSGTFASGLNKIGAGTLAFTSASGDFNNVNVISGTLMNEKAGGLLTGTIVINGGTLKFGSTNTSNTDLIAPTASVTLTSGTLDLNGHAFEDINGLTGGGVVTNSAASGTSEIQVGANNSSSSFGGTIQNGATASISLLKKGSGTLTLTSVHTYTGSTTVNAGTLRLATSNAVATSSGITVNGGTLSVGASQNLSSLTIAAGGTFRADAALLNASPGLVNATSLTFGGTLSLNGTPPVAGTYDIFDWTTASGTFATISLPTAPTGFAWHDFGGGILFDYSTGAVQLDVNLGTPGVWKGVSGASWGVGASWDDSNVPAAATNLTFGNAAAGGVVNLDAVRNVASTISISDGTAGAYNLAAGTGGSLNMTGATTISVTGSQEISAPITGSGALTKTGAGTLTLSGLVGYSGATSVNAGTLVTNGAIQNGAAMVITNAGIIEVPSNGGATGVTRVASLAIDPGAKLVLHDNDLVVENGAGPAAYSALVGLVVGGQITSSTPAPGTTFGVVQNGSGAHTSLSGYVLPNPTISTLVKYTWLGDANLDGKVDGTDYALTDSGFAGGGATWDQGDYNYSSGVDGTDYALIDTGFGSQSGTLPEPTALGLLGWGAMGMLRRRRQA